MSIGSYRSLLISHFSDFIEIFDKTRDEAINSSSNRINPAFDSAALINTENRLFTYIFCMPGISLRSLKRSTILIKEAIPSSTITQTLPR
ncbi:hypothetical protein EYC80_002821 [Monilinia laxa]|uniref:Uncharacterized protein n=1 Tax=Monilinia laxa TaxID=61186 RepID=A0A5N6KBZ8_MONLA|nr:hypothetical protein EYC80_002821 [Monilinia laxa]